MESLNQQNLSVITMQERTRARLEEQISQLESLVPRWISVEEMVPVTTDDVLCYVTSGFQFVGYFEGIRGRWELYGQSRESVTHWMPLPEPPKEDVKK